MEGMGIELDYIKVTEASEDDKKEMKTTPNWEAHFTLYLAALPLKS